MRQERVAPRAAVLIESMRDLGYSLQTALADIIDNSITAQAKSIQLFANVVDKDFSFAIVDNGLGMDEAQLLDAMRPGTRSPHDKRHNRDLGRFGLGLKTASFSQCRRLTVLSRKEGKTCCAIWDLDEVVRTDDWLVQMPEDFSAIPWIDRLGDTGTLVLWEKIDRFTDIKFDTQAQVTRAVDEAVTHLELVFHRFLTGEKDLPKVAMTLNGRRLEPHDPFNSSHQATQADPVDEVQVAGTNVRIQAFTLPHHKKVGTAEWNKYGGKEGYVRNQGFYVYRAKRLIVHGTWFGLARQMELTKLSRVRIDTPNNLDAEWKIDVKKASAQPPAAVRDRLRRLIETIGATSKRVYTSKGRQLVSDERLPVWVRTQDKGDITYGLNPSHPVFTDFLERLPPHMKSEFAKILQLAGSTIPIDSLFADASATPEKVVGTKMELDAILSHAQTTLQMLVKGGLSVESVTDMLSVTEPFRTNWDAIAPHLESLSMKVTP